MRRIIKASCAGCGVGFTTTSSRRKYCTQLCANLTNGKLAGKASYNKGRDRRPSLKQPESYRLVPVMLPNGEYATTMVDIEDYDSVSATNWRCHKGYVVSGTRALRMHRLILSRATGRELAHSEIVDHKNHNTFDNRRCNLRLATASQNAANARKTKDANVGSSFRGVFRIPRRNGGYGWRVSITSKQTHILVGTFHDEVEAAYVYDQFASQLHGEFALTNGLA